MAILEIEWLVSRCVFWCFKLPTLESLSSQIESVSDLQLRCGAQAEWLVLCKELSVAVEPPASRLTSRYNVHTQ